MADTVLVTTHAIPGVRMTETHLVAPVSSAATPTSGTRGPEGRHG
jgi:hypothetical protein